MHLIASKQGNVSCGKGIFLLTDRIDSPSQLLYFTTIKDYAKKQLFIYSLGEMPLIFLKLLLK